MADTMGTDAAVKAPTGIEVINRIARIFQSVNQYMAHDSGGTVVESHRGKFGERTAHHMLLQQGG